MANVIDSASGGRSCTFEQFCEQTGYDPKTRCYRRTAADEAPRAVPGAHQAAEPLDNWRTKKGRVR